MLKCCLIHIDLIFVAMCMAGYIYLLSIWSIFHYHFHFRYDESYNLIKTRAIVLLHILLSSFKSSASVCCLTSVLNFWPILAWCCLKSIAYKESMYLNSIWVFPFFDFIFLLKLSKQEIINKRRHKIHRARRNIVELKIWLRKSF